MKSTPVKDVNALLANLAVNQANKAVSGTGEFQKIWNGQMNKGNDAANAGNAERGSSAKEKNASPVQKDNTVKDTEAGISKDKNAEEVSEQAVAAEEKTDALPEKQENPGEISEIPDIQETDEMTAEDLVRVMEVLGGITAELMQQIAEAFGITLEEVQAAMDQLGMVQADLLDKEKFSNLVLTLGGAEDSYALLTDGELYEKYQMLMAQLDAVLEESGEKLDLDPGELNQVLKAAEAQKTVAEAVPVTVNEVRENVREYAENSATGETAMAVDTVQESVQKTPETANHSAGERSGRHSEEKADRNSQDGMYIQSFRAEQYQSELQQAQEVTQNSPWSESTQEIMNQILDYMKLQLNADSTSLEMQLHPASLGTLQIQLASKAGVVTAHFIAQNEAVKNALETQMVQLREQFEEQGVRVEAIEVTVQTHEFERNLEQGRGRNQQAPEKRGRGRRIQLDGISSIENADEEAAIPESLSSAGSTVEYTA